MVPMPDSFNLTSLNQNISVAEIRRKEYILKIQPYIICLTFVLHKQ